MEKEGLSAVLYYKLPLLTLWRKSQEHQSIGSF